MAQRPSSPPEECAQCGTAIPRSARACPECGADERTGWRETSIYDGLELPDADGNNDDGGSLRTSRPRGGIAWYWIAAGVLLLFVLGLGFLGLR